MDTTMNGYRWYHLSRKYYQDDLEDFGDFLMRVFQQRVRVWLPRIAKWEGKAETFILNLLRPKRGGLVHIRETEELYDGNVTALDNQGRKRSHAAPAKANTTEPSPSGTTKEVFGRKQSMTEYCSLYHQKWKTF